MTAQVDNSSYLLQEIHPDDPVEFESKTTVHRADLDLEIGDCQISERKSINRLREDKLGATDTPYPIQGIGRIATKVDVQQAVC